MDQCFEDQSNHCQIKNLEIDDKFNQSSKKNNFYFHQHRIISKPQKKYNLSEANNEKNILSPKQKKFILNQCSSSKVSAPINSFLSTNTPTSINALKSSFDSQNEFTTSFFENNSPKQIKAYIHQEYNQFKILKQKKAIELKNVKQDYDQFLKNVLRMSEAEFKRENQKRIQQIQIMLLEQSQETLSHMDYGHIKQNKYHQKLIENYNIFTKSKEECLQRIAQNQQNNMSIL